MDTVLIQITEKNVRDTLNKLSTGYLDIRQLSDKEMERLFDNVAHDPILKDSIQRHLEELVGDCASYLASTKK